MLFCFNRKQIKNSYNDDWRKKNTPRSKGSLRDHVRKFNCVDCKQTAQANRKIIFRTKKWLSWKNRGKKIPKKWLKMRKKLQLKLTRKSYNFISVVLISSDTDTLSTAWQMIKLCCCDNINSPPFGSTHDKFSTDYLNSANWIWSWNAIKAIQTIINRKLISHSDMKIVAVLLIFSKSTEAE